MKLPASATRLRQSCCAGFQPANRPKTWCLGFVRRPRRVRGGSPARKPAKQQAGKPALPTLSLAVAATQQPRTPASLTVWKVGALAGKSASVPCFAPAGRRLACWLAVAVAFTVNLAAGETNGPVAPGASLPDMGVSVVRVLGALLLVLALFWCGVWAFKNWQRLIRCPGQPKRLNILEVRSLGARHALYVVGYSQQRFLISASPSGVSLLSHLPSDEEAPAQTVAPPPAFTDALLRMLGRKS